MREGNHWLRDLESRESSATRALFTCYYGHCDNIVFPARNAILSGAANHHHVPGVAHVHLAFHAPIFDDVVSGMKEIARSMKLGGGRSPESQMGPLVSKEQHERVLGYIEKGVREGGDVVTGGSRHGDKGYFVQPTIFKNCGPASTLYREEIFGPVLVANSYKDADEIAAQANDTIYGLAASVWTQNLSLAHRLAKRIEAGTVWVNCHHLIDPALPFGGFKQSGFGREQAADGIELYTETKSVLMRI